MHTALYALFHHRTGYGIGFIDVAHKVIVVCAATAAAYEFSETAVAILAREKTVFGNAFADIRLRNTLSYVAH